MGGVRGDRWIEDTILLDCFVEVVVIILFWVGDGIWDDGVFVFIFFWGVGEMFIIFNGDGGGDIFGWLFEVDLMNFILIWVMEVLIFVINFRFREGEILFGIFFKKGVFGGLFLLFF
jgi:hypothetical protein